MTPKKSDIILGEEGVKNRRKSSDIIYVRSLRVTVQASAYTILLYTHLEINNLRIIVDIKLKWAW